jgi:biopolymer transport protein ExbB/TolQ
MNVMPSSDLVLSLLLSLGALFFVLVPFCRGLRVGLQALGATRGLKPSEIAQALKRSPGERSEPAALQMLRVLGKALSEVGREAHPEEFLIDASRQYVSYDYESHYARPLSMYANILPPIGFIGTTCGLMILFLSMRMADDSLELGALAMALSSSLFALVGFALLEGLKIRLYRRLVLGLDEAIRFHRNSRRSEPKAA